MRKRFLVFLLVLAMFSAMSATGASASSPTSRITVDRKYCNVIYNDANKKAVTADSVEISSDDKTVKCLVAADATLNDDNKVVSDAKNIARFDYAVCDCEDQNAFFRHCDGKYLCSDGTNITIEKDGCSDFNLETSDNGYFIRLGLASETALYLKIDGDVLTCAPMGEDTENYVFTFRSLAADEQELIEYEGFDDVDKKAWFYHSVVFAVEHGLMKGVGNNRFDPNGNVTRAMLVTLLYRNELEPDTGDLDNPFADVKEDQWYTDAVLWAAEAEVVNGMTETSFEPETVISREQIATILYRYADAKELIFSNYSQTDLSGFADSADVSNYAEAAIKWAVRESIIAGIDGKLAPSAPASRAQIATVLMRYFDYIEEQY